MVSLPEFATLALPNELEVHIRISRDVALNPVCGFVGIFAEVKPA